MIVIDTHVWIWWASDPDRLSPAARERIDAAAEVGVCAISCWEVAMLVAKGRLRLDRDVLVWIRHALRLPKVVLLPLDPAIAVAATRLSAAVPLDPADRMIVATARTLDAELVTRDEALRAAPDVRAVW